MKVIKRVKENELANVFIARNNEGKLIEFVESTQPPKTINEKWVLILSTLFGCPVNCKICDAGGNYHGKLSLEELLFQIDYLVNYRFPDGFINSDRFKIQFARMGEPAFNNNVLDLLKSIPSRYKYKRFIPSLSTIAPEGTDKFFDELLKIKKEMYSEEFQLQFSIHSTNEDQRNELIPVKKWGFDKIAGYANKFFQKEGKKITLNFALGIDSHIEVETLLRYFTQEQFLIKITPVNPTLKSKSNNITSYISEKNKGVALIAQLRNAGYDVILSIGEWEENKIGSNCGQYVNAACGDYSTRNGEYTYGVVEIN